MADGSVGVAQAVTPDRQIDNDVVVTDAGTVYRQRTEDVDVAALAHDLRRVLGPLALAVDPATGVLRAVVGGTGAPASTVGTVTTVGTVSALTAGTLTAVTTLANLAPSGVTNPAANLLNQQPLQQRSQIITGPAAAPPDTPGQSSVANSVSSVTLLAANAARAGATIFNDDTAGSGATLKIKLGAVASATSFTYAIPPQGYYEVPFAYRGVIDAIASAATGSARLTELT